MQFLPWIALLLQKLAGPSASADLPARVTGVTEVTLLLEKPCAVESMHQDFQLRSFARDVDVSCPPEHFARKPGGPEDVEDQKTRKSGGPGRRTRQLGEKTWRTTCMTRTTTGPGGPGGPENLEDLEDQENHEDY